MTTSADTTFVGTAGAELSTLPNWHYISGSANDLVDTDGSGVYPSVAAIARYYNDAFLSAADHDSVTLNFDLRAGADNFQIGPVARAQANGDGYLFTYSGASSATPNVFSLYRYNGGTLTILSSALGTIALAAGSHALKIEAVGTGATVTINMYVDGATTPNWTFNDTTANRLTALGYRGLWTFGASSPTTGVMMTSLVGHDSMGEVAAAPFTLTGPSAFDGNVIQSAAAPGVLTPVTSVTRTGTYTGSPASIQSRVLSVATGQTLAGFDWATRVASPTGGVFSYTLANMPAGCWYVEEFRESAANPTVTSPGIKFGIGELDLDAGQSNTEVLSIAGTGTPHPNLRVFDAYRNPGIWTSPTTGAGNIAKGNALIAALGGNIPVGLIQCAMSGSGLAAGSGLATPTSGGVPRDWSVGGASTAQAPSPRVRAVNTMALLNQRPRTVFWGQGESDAMTGIGVSTYQANLTAIFAFLRTLAASDAAIFVGLLGQTNDTQSTAANWDAVRQAQLAAVAADGNAYELSKQDLTCDANSPDMTAANFTVWGSRIAQRIAKHWGLAPYGDGPHIAGVAPVAAGSLTYEIVVAHDGGTDIAPASTTQISDILVTVGSIAVTPASIAKYAADKIHFTLASAPSGTVAVQSCYGKSSTQAGIVHDNTALALPLRASAPIAAGVALATTLNFTAVDAAGQPLTATGLDYAVFDQARLSAWAAPIKKGSGLSITSGAGSVNIAGLTSLTPGGTGSIKYESPDGTISGGGPATVS